MCVVRLCYVSKSIIEIKKQNKNKMVEKYLQLFWYRFSFDSSFRIFSRDTFTVEFIGENGLIGQHGTSTYFEY